MVLLFSHLNIFLDLAGYHELLVFRFDGTSSTVFGWRTKRSERIVL